MHYKDQGHDVVTHFNERLASSHGKKLLVLLDMLRDLPLRSSCKQLNPSTLIKTLVDFGAPAHHLLQTYTTYKHFQDLKENDETIAPANSVQDCVIVNLFHEKLTEKQGNSLLAFEATLDILAAISPRAPLTSASLQEVLTGLGVPVLYINTHYALYMHYKKHKAPQKRVDIFALFQEELRNKNWDYSGAFVATFGRLKSLSSCKQLSIVNLEYLLHYFGVTVPVVTARDRKYLQAQLRLEKEALVYKAA